MKDALTKHPLESDIVIIDNQKNEVAFQTKSNSETGAFLVVLPSGKNYGISVNKKDFLFHSENFDIPPSTSYQEINRNIELKKALVGAHIILRNIFFNYDQSTLRPESSSELEKLFQMLRQAPNLKIEISGHTDNKGTTGYNKVLSEARAKAVVNFLIEKGISSARLGFTGYGFDRPIATNETEEGRQQNRRTEFEIISK